MRPIIVLVLRECLEVARNHAHYKSAVAEGAGRGMSPWVIGSMPGMQSSATLNVIADGHVSVLTGSPGHRRFSSIYGADGIGSVGYSFRPHSSTSGRHRCGGALRIVTGGSRTTLATGQAVIQAAEQCVAEMCRRAAAEWNVEARRRGVVPGRRAL